MCSLGYVFVIITGVSVIIMWPECKRQEVLVTSGEESRRGVRQYKYQLFFTWEGN